MSLKIATMAQIPIVQRLAYLHENQEQRMTQANLSNTNGAFINESNDAAYSGDCLDDTDLYHLPTYTFKQLDYGLEPNVVEGAVRSSYREQIKLM